MSKLFWKNKIKWNISVLVIFVLLASSLIGVLTMNFLKQMISYTSEAYSYHKSYYLSKAWLELALVEVKNADIGFSNVISGYDSIFTDNFDCDDCSFDLNIQWKAQHLSDKFWISHECNNDNAFIIKKWDSLILPLFVQKEIGLNLEVFKLDKEYNFEPLKYRKDLKFISNQSYSNKLNLWLIILSGTDVQRDYLFIKSYDSSIDVFKKYFQEFDDFYGNFLNNKNFFSYLIISNPNTEDLSFCVFLEANQWWVPKLLELATNSFFISSVASYSNKTVGLQAIFAQPIPSFLASTYLE